MLKSLKLADLDTEQILDLKPLELDEVNVLLLLLDHVNQKTEASFQYLFKEYKK